MARRLYVQKKTPAPTFFPFGRLPIELRDKIWFTALPGPRIVELFFEIIPSTSASPTSLDLDPTKYDIKVISPTKPPNVLFVNQESESETRRKYKELNLGPGFQIPNRIFIDFSIDTVYLSTIRNSIPSPHSTPTLTPTLPHTINLSQSPQLYHLKSLAISSDTWPHLFLPFLKSCPNLTSLTIAFQKSTLHNIKPASEAETLIFMHDSEYFSDKNRYTQRVFAADWGIRVKAVSDLNAAKAGILRFFEQEDLNGPMDVMEEDSNEIVGVLKGEKTVREPWIGSAGGLVNVYEVAVEGRNIDLCFMMALYPREKMFESLGRD